MNLAGPPLNELRTSPTLVRLILISIILLAKIKSRRCLSFKEQVNISWVNLCRYIAKTFFSRAKLQQQNHFVNLNYKPHEINSK